MKKYSLLFLFVHLFSWTRAGQHPPVLIPYEDLGGKLIISAVVNGQQGRFMFDTGAGPCVITEEFGEKAGVAKVSGEKVTDSNGGARVMDAGQIDKLGLGELVFAKVRTIISSNVIFKCFAVDGILGVNLLADKIVAIDGAAKTITLSTDKSAYDLGQAQGLAIHFQDENEHLPVFSIGLVGNGMEIPQTTVLDMG